MNELKANDMTRHVTQSVSNGDVEMWRWSVEAGAWSRDDEVEARGTDDEIEQCDR